MRYPYLRGDLENPIDVETTIDGIRFIGVGGASATIAWQDISGVRLFIESPDDSWLPFEDVASAGPLIASPLPFTFTCTVSFKSHSQLTIRHGVTDTSSSLAYRQIVEDIHLHLARAGRRVRLRAGHSWWAFLLLPVYSVWFLATYWWLIPLLVMFGWRRNTDTRRGPALFWRNRPRRYRVGHIPQSMIPASAISPIAGSPSR